ncbi:MAG: gliding motility-associated ABC transporter ATP-binding subunit GldA [Bacteroidetes bacterium]|nr:MAG: gliding motility-associated ABC transporter ATP-binding subunit GldA [Bacteroidota bacterium]
MSIEVRHLSKFYGEQAAVNDISFKVNRGEIVAFLGPNGAGKSTTMKMITGFIPTSKGEAFVCDQLVKMDSLDTRRKIGYLPENNPLYLDMYVKEYLEFVARIYKVGNYRSRVDEMVQRVGLELEQKKLIGKLSKGYRQRVGLAQAIIHDPEVLILDEPTSGLDPNQLVEIRELIKQIGKEKTVMLSTHIMQEVEAICDRVIIIKRGEIVADDKAANLQYEADSQVVFVEFDGQAAKNQLRKIEGVTKVESLEENSWLIEAQGVADIRKNISRFAQQHDLLVLTIRKEEKTLEEVFKKLTSN